MENTYLIEFKDPSLPRKPLTFTAQGSVDLALSIDACRKIGYEVLSGKKIFNGHKIKASV